jgi:cobalamin transport system ATP-binding protein
VSATPPSALRLDGVTVRYDSRTALSGIDLSVRPGEFVALAGPNGSGKTTLLRCVLGFLQPVEGSVEVLGAPVLSLSVRDRARRIAWVPQEEGARDDVRLLEYVLYGRYAHLGPLEGEGERDRISARRALDDLGLGDRANDGILSLSGGERQRAVLARALVQQAPVLLLDEPTAHLDIGHQLDLLARVQGLARRGSVTVVAALHDLNLAARFADRIVVLARGRKVADGSPTDVLSEELLERVWGVVASLRRDPRTGAPYLLPLRPVSSTPRGPPPIGRGPVHVVGGGGAAAPVLQALVDEGYRVTAGVLNLLDSDQEAAERLGIPCAVEAPFAPIGADTRAQGRTLLEGARMIVVAAFPVGPSNLANLEDLRPFVGRIPVLLLARSPGVPWDFAGGAATRAVDELRAAGALDVPGIPGLLEQCALRLPPTPAVA